jgi:hypothetical protein
MLMRTDPVREAVAFEPDELLRVDVVQDQQAEVLSDEAVERERLRLEFEAIIAAGYREGADEPRSTPPAPRVATIVKGGRPSAPSAAPTGAADPGRLRSGPTAGPAPRERGPPASGPDGFAARCALLPGFPSLARHPAMRAGPLRRSWTGSGSAGVRRHRTST